MCPTRESTSDYRSLTPEQWERARQQILGRAYAARARTLRELAGAVVHPLQAIVAGAAVGIVDLAEAVAATVRKLGRAYALRRERKAAARELRALDDHTLRDIGVNRSEIDWVVDSVEASDRRTRDGLAVHDLRARKRNRGSVFTFHRGK